MSTVFGRGLRLLKPCAVLSACVLPPGCRCREASYGELLVVSLSECIRPSVQRVCNCAVFAVSDVGRDRCFALEKLLCASLCPSQVPSERGSVSVR
eukprot:6707903-Pyramimonas_sp.AAC.1